MSVLQTLNALSNLLVGLLAQHIGKVGYMTLKQMNVLLPAIVAVLLLVLIVKLNAKSAIVTRI